MADEKMTAVMQDVRAVRADQAYRFASSMVAGVPSSDPVRFANCLVFFNTIADWTTSNDNAAESAKRVTQLAQALGVSKP